MHAVAAANELNDPRGQGVHDADPATALKVPRPHSMHVNVLVPLMKEPKRPGGQGWQAAAVAEPVPLVVVPVGHKEHMALPATLNIPTAQGVHAVEFTLALKLPAGHTTHPAAVVRTLPAGQEASPVPDVAVQLAAPATDVVPAVHGVHDTAAFTSEYDPAGHTEHAVEPTALEKVPFWHSAHMMLPLLFKPNRPAGQGMQDAAPPVTLVLEPKGHGEHTVDPTVAAKVPT